METPGFQTSEYELFLKLKEQKQRHAEHTKAYAKTEKGKEINRNNSRIYYNANREQILEKKKLLRANKQTVIQEV